MLDHALNKASSRPLRGATFPGGQLLSHPLHFNPRAPCGARPASPVRDPFNAIFQSTRPLRGATPIRSGGGQGPAHFNPRAPCGARLASVWLFLKLSYFNPRAPCGARRPGYADRVWFPYISIHAPLAGRDYFCTGMSWQDRHFNPRAPYGARRRTDNG